MTQTDYIIKRNKWLEEVSYDCHNFALQNDLDFYAFQTPIETYNPDLLIIGINPGGGRSYSSILKEKGIPKRSASDLAFDVNTLTTKPQWEIDDKMKGNDVMRNKFAKLFSAENGFNNILDNSVMMNMVYFNTPKEADLNSVNSKAKAYCISKTIEFIDVLNPKHVLFITSDDNNLKKCSVTDVTRIGNNITEGLLNGRKVYTIPHYGNYGAYSNIKIESMGKALSTLLK